MAYLQNQNIDHGKAFDWGQTSQDYAKYRDIYPDIFYQKIVDLGLCISGQTVLDLGTGTGVLPRNMYKYGAKFVGADVSENQIYEAKRLSKESGYDIDFIVSSAENIEFPSESFDVVTACQCFMYFDKSIVLPKIHKLLKNNGHFCILFMTWLPFEDEIAKHSEELVLKHNPSWTGAGFSRNNLMTKQDADLTDNLFEIEHHITYDISVPFTRETWHGRIKACRGIGASSMTEQEISSFETQHIEYLSTLPNTFDILHFASILNLRKKH